MSNQESQVVPAPPRRIVPVEDQPFWDALDAGSFMLARCVCGAHYARTQACLRCGAGAQELTWVPASGHGKVRTFIIFDKPYHAYFKERTPYAVAVVALDEGPEIMTNVIDIEVEKIEIGMPVRIVIDERGGYSLHQASAQV